MVMARVADGHPGVDYLRPAWEDDRPWPTRRVSVPRTIEHGPAERDAPAVIELLRHRGIGVEAGLASAADAERLVKLSGDRPVLRILIEIEEQDLGVARQVAMNIAAVLDRAGLRRPILLHGVDATVWHFVEIAHQRRWSTRVGLEDGKHLPDGTIASDNAALVTAALAMFRA